MTRRAAHPLIWVIRSHFSCLPFVLLRLLKNGVPFARLVPEGERVCRGNQLAAALTEVALGSAEGRAWSREERVLGFANAQNAGADPGARTLGLC